MYFTETGHVLYPRVGLKIKESFNFRIYFGLSSKSALSIAKSSVLIYMLPLNNGVSTPSLCSKSITQAASSS